MMNTEDIIIDTATSFNTENKNEIFIKQNEILSNQNENLTSIEVDINSFDTPESDTSEEFLERLKLII